jgi:DNA-binding transcriptional LysR family regulator
MSFDMRGIQAFVLVAELSSFRVAAQAMYADPSTVSRLVHKFEVAIGSKLLLRTTRSVELTAAGQQALPHAQHMLEAAHALTLAVASRPGTRQNSARGQRLAASGPPDHERRFTEGEGSALEDHVGTSSHGPVAEATNGGHCSYG